MAAYEKTAQKANSVAKVALDSLPEEQQPDAAVNLVQLFNYGIRCGRPVHRTQRLNACRIMSRDLPVTVTMKRGEENGKEFNYIEVLPIRSKD